jgi:hypothetical protein
MADIVLQKSVAELIDPKAASTSLSWTAGGASDSVTWTGISIDREGMATGSLPRSCDAVVFYDATLGSGQTLAFYWDLQEGPDGTNWSDYATEASTVVATGPSGGGRVVGVARLVTGSADAPAGTPGVNLGSARRYVRLNVVPHLSRTGTDTAVMATVIEFGGFDQLASPQT